MNRLLYGSALGVLGLFLLPVQQAQAACTAQQTYPTGAMDHTYVKARVYAALCDSEENDAGGASAYVGETHVHYPGYAYEKRIKRSRLASAQAGGLSVSAYGLGSDMDTGSSTPIANAYSGREFTVTTHNPNDVVEFKVQGCSNANTAGAYLYNGKTTWAVIGGSGGSGQISHQNKYAPHNVCNAEQTVSVTAVDYEATITAYISTYAPLGRRTVDAAYYEDSGNVSANLSVSVTNLGSHVGCESSSGDIVGCDFDAPPAPAYNAWKVFNYGGLNSTMDNSDAHIVNTGGVGSSGDFGPQVNAYEGPNQCLTTANPMNFAYGFKQKTVRDYRGGALSFVRNYRSDSDWTSDSIGERWRHSFDRGLSFATVGSVLQATVTDEGGSQVIFEDNSGTWDAQDSDITTQLESVIDSGSVVGYIYTTNRDTREYYDLDGLVTRIEYRGNEAIDLAYDVSDRLITVTDDKGDSLTLSYNVSGYVSSVVTPTGTFTYGYDGSGNLTSVTKPDTESMSYQYDNASYPHALTGVTDETGTLLESYLYDSEGRPTFSYFDGYNDSYSISYNADYSSTVTNPLGKQTTYHFETINGLRKVTQVEGHQSANCAAANKDYTYDVDGRMTSKTDWLGNITTYTYDSRGLVTSTTQADGDTVERTITTTYDATLRAPDVITNNGLTTDYDYDADGRVTLMTVTDVATSESRATSYTYNANTTDVNGNTVLGRVATVNGPRTDLTDTTSYTYDAQNRRIKTTNALGHESETTSFDADDRPLIIEDANNIQTVFVYDALGRVSSSTVASGTLSAATTSYTYDEAGNVLTVTSPNGVVMTYEYDNAQQMVRMLDSLGNDILYVRDAAGNITKEEYREGATIKYTHSKVFDELSRVLESVDANDNVTANAYDVNSNVTSTTDGNSNATSYAFDGLNRLISQTDALSGVTEYGLNDLDQTEDVTDPRTNVTSYTYNAFGDVLTETSPDRGTRTYTYDGAGNMVSMTDGRGVVSNYTYDAINRVTSVTYPSDSSLDQSFTYDALSGCGASIGRLCSVTDAGGATAYVYDDLGRLTSATETRGALSFTKAYDYDEAGVLTSITLPSGRTVDYTLNANAQVSAVSTTLGGTTQTIASGVSYLPFGGVTGLTFGNSIALTNTYDTAYQLTSKQHGTLMNDSYSYDDAGNITVRGATTYDYDALYRLTDEDSDTYSYDAIGNRLTRNLDTYTYPSTSSKLSDAAGDTVTYDAGGNITDDDNRTYVINAAGQLESVSIGGSVVGAYTYDANNQRTQKVAGGVTTHYVHGKNGLLYGEYDASGAMIREYIYLNGSPIAQIESNGDINYLHTDHLGTPRFASDGTGTQVWAWDSDAFGNGVPTGTATVNLRFAGQYFDDESDLHYNWNRYYDPDTGRYISSDPIGLEGGLNTFAYVGANPVMYYDPEGLVMWDLRVNLSTATFKQFTTLSGHAVAVSHERDALNRCRMAGIIKLDGAGLTAAASLLPFGVNFLEFDTSFEDGQSIVDEDELSGSWVLRLGQAYNLISGAFTFNGSAGDVFVNNNKPIDGTAASYHLSTGLASGKFHSWVDCPCNDSDNSDITM